MPPLIFAHANGYPPGSYRCLLEAVGEGLGQVVATHTHRPLVTNDPAPRFLSWQEYASDLIVRIERDGNGPVWLLGHSMGAACGVLAAARRPDLFIGIVAFDPVLIPTNLWFWSRVFNSIKPDGIPIVKRALGRPHTFESHQGAFDFYRGKRVFESVRSEVLMDYVTAGHSADSEGTVTLRHSGAWEACIYRSVPRMSPSLRALPCPLHIIAGESSEVLTSNTLRWARKLNDQVSEQYLPGGHLVPLEAPEACASATVAFLDRCSDASR